MPKPGNGFSLQTQSDVPMNDPYQAQARASQDDSVWSALMTESGRQAIGAQMAVPIRTELD